MKKNQARGRPKAFEREAIVEIAMDNYWQQGLEVSLNSICKQACIAKTSLYREFENEDGLKKAALDKYFNIAFTQLKSILFGPESFQKKIKTISKFFCDDISHTNGCLFVKMRANAFQLGPKTKNRIQEIDQEIVDLYIEFFKMSRINKNCKCNLSDRDAANFLASQLELALTQRARGVSSSEISKVLDIGLAVLTEESK